MLINDLKKLTYRLRYRGIKELDLSLGTIAFRLDELSREEIETLEQLIQEEENKIYVWILGLERAPPAYKSIFEKLLT